MLKKITEKTGISPLGYFTLFFLGVVFNGIINQILRSSGLIDFMLGMNIWGSLLHGKNIFLIILVNLFMLDLCISGFGYILSQNKRIREAFYRIHTSSFHDEGVFISARSSLFFVIILLTGTILSYIFAPLPAMHEWVYYNVAQDLGVKYLNLAPLWVVYSVIGHMGFFSFNRMLGYKIGNILNYLLVSYDHHVEEHSTDLSKHKIVKNPSVMFPLASMILGLYKHPEEKQDLSKWGESARKLHGIEFKKHSGFLDYVKIFFESKR